MPRFLFLFFAVVLYSILPQLFHFEGGLRVGGGGGGSRFPKSAFYHLFPGGKTRGGISTVSGTYLYVNIPYR